MHCRMTAGGQSVAFKPQLCLLHEALPRLSAVLTRRHDWSDDREPSYYVELSKQYKSTVSEYRYATHDEAGIRKEEKTEYKEINLSAKSYKTDCRTDINSCRGGCGSEHHRDNDYTGEDSKAIVAILEHDCLF